MMKQLAIIYLIWVCICVSSCTIDGEAGVANVYIRNSSSSELRIENTYTTRDQQVCYSCTCISGQQLLTASLGDIGTAPLLHHIIKKINIYHNDSLKIESSSPFSDLNISTSKGANRYDKNYIITISDDDLN